jgi:small-conductance mechanosensitive channel
LNLLLLLRGAAKCQDMVAGSANFRHIIAAKQANAPDLTRRNLVSQRLLPIVAFVGLLLASPALAQSAPGPAAAPAVTRTVTPEEAQRALETLQDDAKRAQMLDTLRAIAGASPPTAAPEPDTGPLAADSLGAQLLLSLSEQIGETSRDIADAARTVTRFPALWHWLQRTANDPASYDILLDIAWKLVLVFGCALCAEWLVGRAVRRPLMALQARIPAAARLPARLLTPADPPSSLADLTAEPELRRRRIGLAQLWQSLVRLPFVLGRLLLELLPVIAFAGIAMLLLSTAIGDQAITRLAILAVVNAYAICRGLACAARALVCPPGLFTVRAETAAYIEIWVRRLAAVGAGGIALANIALLFGLHHGGYAALLRLVMLVVHLLVVVIILQCRRPVAAAIRAGQDRSGAVSAARNWIAGLWHVLAIAVVLALWAVWALNVRNGYALLLQYFAGSLAVVLITRLLGIVVLSLIDRGFRINPDILQRFPGLEARANRYLPLLRRIVSAIIAAIGLVAMLEVWGVDAVVWFHGDQIGSRLLSAVVTVGIAAFAAAAIWEATNALIDRQLTTLSRDGHFARAARLRTFQPMLRTALFCLIVTVVALTALSEIGVNVAPLLAGAGIVGIAIGFGSQKLVQDVITGLFLLLENVVQVGDLVTVSGLSGTVENLSIRTIRLRAGDGAVHIVPFSAVTSVTNASRGAGNAAVSVNVSYREDTDRVGQILKDIVAEMRNESDYKSLIRGDLELWGVDKVDGAMASIVGQIRCTADGRWPVQREFNARMKRRFQECGVEIASAGQTILMQAPVAQDAPAAEDSQPARRRAAG